MFFSDKRTDLRATFYDVWQKMQNRQPMTPLEDQIAQVIDIHPEYHHIFENQEKYQDKDYSPEMGEQNPFLHMSIHQAIHEQVSTNRPKGIQSVYLQLSNRHGSRHEAEHIIGDVLIEVMWDAQRNNTPYDDKKYIKKLKKCLKS